MVINNPLNLMRLSLVVVSVVLICMFDFGQAGDLQWDELIFTQEWGFSACRQFKDRSSEQKKCRFEGKPSVWSVHGIWPTKGGSKGPNFCKKVKFDVEALTPIIKELDEFWYEIDESKDAHHFWEHEWLKHGSCAMELDIFNTELRYFGEGLTLRNKLDLYSILKAGGIIPSNDKGYMLADIEGAFKKAIGLQSAVPYVQCLKTKNAQTNAAEYHILQFEICLNPQLQVVDCNTKKRNIQNMISQHEVEGEVGDQAEPCPGNEPIWYNDYAQSAKKSDGKTSYQKSKFSKPYFAKNLPMVDKYWKKHQRELKHHYLSTNLVR